MNTNTLVGLLLGLVLVSLPPTPGVRAGGFEIPDNGTFALGRGGAFIVRADDPTAMILNPGGLARLSGTHILLNHVLIWEHSEFTRQPTELPAAPTTHEPNAPVENEKSLFPIGAMLIATTDFGSDNWTFAAGIYGPSAHGSKKYPVEGGQRYMLTQLDTVLLYGNLAVAYGVDDVFGVGATLQYVMAPQVKLQLVTDASPKGTALHPNYSSSDVEAVIDMKDLTSFSAIVGAWWRVIPELELGLSGRVIPARLNLAGDITLLNTEGSFSPAQLEITNSAARLDLTIPPSVRAGIRYRNLCPAGGEIFDLELDVVYEAWSMIEDYKVELDGEIQLFGGAPAPDTVIGKAWKDTVSVRLGGTWNVIPDLQLSAGAYYETGAVPKNYEHLDFLSFDRVGLGLGVRGSVGGVRLSAAYAHVFQEDRAVDEHFGKVYQVRPIDPCPGCDGDAGWSGVPANAGKFVSSYDMLAFGLEFDL